MLLLLETQSIYTLKTFLNKIEIEKKTKRSYSILVREFGYKKLRNVLKIDNLEHPKIAELKKVVTHEINRNASSRILIFTQYRDTVNYLKSIL